MGGLACADACGRRGTAARAACGPRRGCPRGRGGCDDDDRQRCARSRGRGGPGGMGGAGGRARRPPRGARHGPRGEGRGTPHLRGAPRPGRGICPAGRGANRPSGARGRADGPPSGRARRCHRDAGPVPGGGGVPRILDTDGPGRGSRRGPRGSGPVARRRGPRHRRARGPSPGRGSTSQRRGSRARGAPCRRGRPGAGAGGVRGPRRRWAARPRPQPRPPVRRGRRRSPGRCPRSCRGRVGRRRSCGRAGAARPADDAAAPVPRAWGGQPVRGRGARGAAGAGRRPRGAADGPAGRDRQDAGR